MAVKYSHLPMSASGDEGESCLTFDYSSAFTYGNTQQSQSNNFKSAFTYGHPEVKPKTPSSELPLSSSDKAVRILVTCGFLVIFILTFPVAAWFCFKKLAPEERVVIFRLGRLHASKGPGWVCVFPLLDRCHRVNVRLRAFSVPPKQVITGDGGVVEIGAEVYFQVCDAARAVSSVQNLDQSTRVLLQTLLCNLLAQRPLGTIEPERKAIAVELQELSNEVCRDWGLEISRVELSQAKVLSEPPPKPQPTVMMPPGLFGGGEGGIASAALTQLAQAFAASDDEDPGKAISSALQAFSEGLTKPSSAQPPDVQPGSSQPPVLQTVEPPAPVQPPLSPQELVSAIRRVLDPSLVQEVQACFLFEIAGGGTYHLNLKDGSGELIEGQDPTMEPDATLSLTLDDLGAMLSGRLPPYQAYMSGRLKVSGDISMALRLEALGKRVRGDL